MHVTLVVEIGGLNRGDCAGDPTCLGIRAHVIADLELLGAYFGLPGRDISSRGRAEFHMLIEVSLYSLSPMAPAVRTLSSGLLPINARRGVGGRWLDRRNSGVMGV